MAKTVDVAEVIGSQRFGPFQLTIVALCGMIQFLDGFDTQALAYAAPELRVAWNLNPADLGQAFALGAFGTGLGSVLLGLLADILGRRKVMILTVTIFGVLTFGTAFLSSIGELQIWRLLTGFGLGAALPLTFVIANEFAPLRIRARMISFMACGFALGALSGGLLEAALIPYLGWQAIFYVGGIVPLLLAAALAAFLPESIRFLATQGGKSAEIARIFRRMNRELDYPDDTTFVVPAEPKREGFQPVQLFTEKRAAIGMLNTLNNWLPVAINMAGLPSQRAVLMTTLFQFGGIAGVLSLGALADRVGYHRVLIMAYAILAVFIAAIGSVGGAQAAIGFAVAGTGLFLVGANNTLGAFASTLYPTAIRATGVSWGSSFGRLLGSLGPLLGGKLLQALPLQQTFLIFAVPALIASVGVVGMLRVRPKVEPFAATQVRARA